MFVFAFGGGCFIVGLRIPIIWGFFVLHFLCVLFVCLLFSLFIVLRAVASVVLMVCVVVCLCVFVVFVFVCGLFKRGCVFVCG